MPDSKKESPWNSLEVTKIILALVIVASGTFLTNNYARQSEVVKKRVELWDKISTPLNGIYCYFMYVGDWKNFDATQILKFKRDADRTVYSNQPYFTQKFIHEYEKFMKSSFRTYTGWGNDAQLRTTLYGRRKDESEKTPKDRFCVEVVNDKCLNKDDYTSISERKPLNDAYLSLLEELNDELQLGNQPVLPPIHEMK